MTARGTGVVIRTLGGTILASLPGARVGDGVRVRGTGVALRGEVTGVERARIAIAPYGSVAGIAVGDRVEISDDALFCPAGFAALGRAFDAAGLPLDGGAPLGGLWARVERASAPRPAARGAIGVPFWTGVRAIDGLLTLGRGARVGIFGAAGAGKTSLLETIAGGARADAVVLALVGERGREARAWFERLDRRTAIVCATSDRSAAERVRAADVGMTQAQRLCDAGSHVVLVVDSLARYVAALREQSVGLGEPVGRGGYPPSVWAALARYLERAGPSQRGSITLLATVLCEGPDDREPVSEAARSLLDGHIVLSNALAQAGHFPAIDVPASRSRTMEAVASGEHARAARSVRGALALLAESKDARSFGLAPANDAPLAAALAGEASLAAFLQHRGPSEPAETLRSLASLSAVISTSR